MPSTTPALSCFFDGSTAPAPGVNAQNFSVRWTRTDTYAAATYRFTGTTDDGMRIKVDSTTVVDAWFDQGQTTYYADMPLSAGSHTVVVEYYNKTNAGIAEVTVQDVTTLPTGWTGQYFANANLSGPAALTRNDPAINFTWTNTSPAPGTIPTTNFSARWTQSLPFSAGVYQFTTTSDDGARVYVDGQIILNSWIPQGGVTHSVNVQMTAGNHTVIVEYYQAAGGASMKFDLLARPDFGFATDTIVVGPDTADRVHVLAGRPHPLRPEGRHDQGLQERRAARHAVLHRLAGEHRPATAGCWAWPSTPASRRTATSTSRTRMRMTRRIPGGAKTSQVIRVNATTPLGDVADPASKLVLLGSIVGNAASPSCENFATTADCIPSDGISHSMGNLKFGPDGMLYIATGDALELLLRGLAGAADAERRPALRQAPARQSGERPGAGRQPVQSAIPGATSTATALEGVGVRRAQRLPIQLQAGHERRLRRRCWLGHLRGDQRDHAGRQPGLAVLRRDVSAARLRRVRPVRGAAAATRRHHAPPLRDDPRRRIGHRGRRLHGRRVIDAAEHVQGGAPEHVLVRRLLPEHDQRAQGRRLQQPGAGKRPAVQLERRRAGAVRDRPGR